MIWLIVLAVWFIASVSWWYSMYKEYGFLRVCDIYQGIFASIPSGIIKIHEYLDDHWRGWNYPLFMNKELKADIDFTNKGMDEHIKNVAKELMEEIDKEIEREDVQYSPKGLKKVSKKIKSKMQNKNHVIQENIDRMTPAEKKKLTKTLKGKVGKIK